MFKLPVRLPVRSVPQHPRPLHYVAKLVGMAIGEAQSERVVGKFRRPHVAIGRDRGLGPVRFLAFGLQRRFVGREIIVAVIVVTLAVAVDAPLLGLERLHAVELCAQRLDAVLAQDVVGIAVVLHGPALRKRISMFSSSFATKVARLVTSSRAWRCPTSSL